MEENRFKLARTKYNKHGYQGVPTVEKQTSVSHSVINALEITLQPPAKPRETSYLTVKKLAEHYGVSADYLLGLDDYPTKDVSIRAVQVATGLTSEAIESIVKNYKVHFAAGLSEVLSNDRFIDIITGIIDLRDMRYAADHAIDILKREMNGDNPPLIIEKAAKTSGNDDLLPEDRTDYIIDDFNLYFGELRMQLFELGEAWSDFLESLVPTRNIVAEGKELYRKYVLR